MSAIYPAYAKLNLALYVRGKRPDGYHDLDGVMLRVALSDSLSFAPGPAFSLAADCALPEENTISRAAVLYAERANNPDFAGAFQLQKRIPIEAGLGGGSTDGAAALMALQEAYGALPLRELFRAAREIGADVPFALLGGLARAEGIGDRLTPLPPCPAPLWFLIGKPHAGVSTGALFSKLALEEDRPAPELAPLLAALRAGDLPAIGHALHNDLFPAACELLPAIGAYLERMRSLGALGASMTGAGSAVFGLFPDEDSAKAAEEKAGFDWSAVVCAA